MYAVIESGGKQYRVQQGDIIKLEKLAVEPGKNVEFDKVLLQSDGDKNIKIGTPLIKGAKVIGEVIDHGKGKKIDIIKFRRRKHHLKHQGHRQQYTEVKITKVE